MAFIVLRVIVVVLVMSVLVSVVMAAEGPMKLPLRFDLNPCVNATGRASEKQAQTEKNEQESHDCTSLLGGIDGIPSSIKRNILSSMYGCRGVEARKSGWGGHDCGRMCASRPEKG